MNYQARVIDLKNLLVECLFKWRVILAIALFGAAGAASVVIYMNRDIEPTRELSYEEQVELARDKLTEDEIRDAEEVAAQNRINGQTYRAEVDNTNHALIMEMDAEHASVCKVMYVLDTSQAYLADTIGSLIMTDDTFARIGEVLEVDTDPQYLSELLSIWDDATTTLDGSGDTASDTRFQSVIYVRAIAYTDEQAREIIDIVDARLRELILDQRNLDADITLTYVDEVPTRVSTTIGSIQQDLATRRTNAAKQLTTLADNDKSPFSYEQKLYYNLLIADSHDPVIKEGRRPISVIRYSVEGFCGCAMVGALLVLLYLFLFNRNIRSLMELETVTDIPTLAVYERRRKGRRDPITRWGIHLQTDDVAVQDEDAYQSVLRMRVQELMQHHNKSSLYIIADEQILTSDADLAAANGMPSVSASDMQAFLAADCVILVTYMYRTEFKELSNIIDLCRVHDKQILGNVVIYDAERHAERS